MLISKVSNISVNTTKVALGKADCLNAITDTKTIRVETQVMSRRIVGLVKMNRSRSVALISIMDAHIDFIGAISSSEHPNDLCVLN